MAEDKDKKLDWAAIMKAVQEKNKAKEPKAPKEAKPPKTLKGAKLTKTHKPKAERAENPAEKTPEKPAREPKALKTDMKTVTRALTAQDPREAIMSLARSKESLERLLENNANRAKATKIILDGVKSAMGKKGRETTLAVLESAESDEEAIGIVRGYLFDYVPRGNKLYAEEIAPLKKYGKKEMAAPLDADTLVAAAAYIWRWKKDNPKDQLDLRPEMPKDRETAKAGRPEVPVMEAPLKATAEIRKYQDTVLGQVSGFIKGDPKGLLDFENGGKKDFAAPLPPQVRVETLNLLAQSLFNHLKENDPLFEKFIAMKKDEFKRMTGSERDERYDGLMDLPGKRTVRMHEREADTMVIAREGGRRRENATMEASAVVKLLQEYLNQNAKTSNRLKADLGKDYTPARADGMADSALLRAYSVYCWRIRPENRDRPAASWQKEPEKKAVKYEVPL